MLSGKGKFSEAQNVYYAGQQPIRDIACGDWALLNLEFIPEESPKEIQQKL